MVMNPELVLWGVGTSRTIRPHWALHELKLPYTRKPILPRTGETETPEYTALNPRQKVPLLQDHTLVIGESAAIIAYLAKTYPDQAASLIPKDSETYAKWLEWCFFIVTELDSTSLYVMRRHGQIKGLSHIYGDAPGVVAQAAEYFRKQLKHVDAALSDGREYLLGEQFTTADILLTTCLTWAIDYQVAICDSATPYLDRVLNRSAYRDASAANKPG
jgi:glutathione S-transferase